MPSVVHSRILGVCRKVEEAAAEFYHRLARAHRAEGAVSALWTKTAREEENHARQVEMVLRQRAPTALGLKVNQARAEQALAMLQSLIEAVEREPPPVQQALEEAITIEKVLVQFHADYAVEFADPAYQQLFRSMMAADRDHVAALEAALEALVGRGGQGGAR